MNRQKKEIIKAINQIHIDIAVDEDLSCGMHPDGAYDMLYERIDALQEQLAALRHYGSAEEMMLDDRGCCDFMGPRIKTTDQDKEMWKNLMEMSL